MFRPRSVRQFVRSLTPALVVAGTVFATMSFVADPAGATSCGTATQTNCTSTGTLTLSGGALSLTAPASLAWSGTMAGASLSLYDANLADEGYQVSDQTGTGAGWHVTLSATTFTTGSHSLSDTGTFSTNGSITSASSTSAPTPTCVVANTCTLPTNSTTYPVAITTAASAPTAVNIYDTAVNTGLGNVQIGGSSAPLGWWLNVPATTYAGTYTSTVTFAIVSGP